MTWFASNKKRGHLRIPDSPLGGEDESFIESSQAIEVHHFQRKLDVLVYTTPLLSLAVAAHLVVVMMRDVRPHVHGSETWVDMEGPWYARLS